MTNVGPKLWIGTIAEIPSASDFKIVNVSHTQHYLLHEWRIRDGVDRSNDPCYLVCEDEENMISVNWVDAYDSRYFNYQDQGVKIIKRLLDYIDINREKQDVLIVCNKGESRAPSVAMLYLAKRLDFTGNKEATYGEAREKFTKLYPNYLPGKGITTFLIENWTKL